MQRKSPAALSAVTPLSRCLVLEGTDHAGETTPVTGAFTARLLTAASAAAQVTPSETSRHSLLTSGKTAQVLDSEGASWWLKKTVNMRTSEQDKLRTVISIPTLLSLENQAVKRSKVMTLP